MLRPGTFALTLLLAALTALGPLSIDMYLPSLPDIGRALAAPTARVQLTISSYLIGFAVGQIIYGPFSDRYGRRPVLLVAVALYVAGVGICAATPSIDPLIVGALLAGHRGSGCDRAGARHRARSLFGRTGGARTVADGVDQRVCADCGADDRRRVPDAVRLARKLHSYGGCRRHRFCDGEPITAGNVAPAQREPFSLKWLGGGYISLLRHRSFLAYLAILTISYAGLFAWISGAAVVLQGIYGMSAVTFGFTFALGAAGYMAGAASAARLVQRLGLDRMMGLGVSLLAAGGTGLAAAVAAQIPTAFGLLS